MLIPINVVFGVLLQPLFHGLSLGLEPFYRPYCYIFKPTTNNIKAIRNQIQEIVHYATCGRVVLQSQQVLGQIGAVDAIFSSSVARQGSLVAFSTSEGDGHRVDHVLLVDVACCNLRRVVLNSTGAGRYGVGVHVDLGAQLIFLVISCQHFSNGRLDNIEDVAVAFELLLGGAAQIRTVLGMVPDTHRVT